MGILMWGEALVKSDFWMRSDFLLAMRDFFLETLPAEAGQKPG